MTDYTVTPGYTSHLPFGTVWPELKAVVREIQNDTKRIIDEVLMLEPELDPAEIERFAAMYSHPVTDLTLKIDNRAQTVTQLASGGGSDRDLKQSCRRAFCRLVMYEMHKRKMEICINVN